MFLLVLVYISPFFRFTDHEMNDITMFFEIYNFSVDIFLFTFDTMCFAFSHESNMPIFPLVTSTLPIWVRSPLYFLSYRFSKMGSHDPNQLPIPTSVTSPLIITKMTQQEYASPPHTGPQLTGPSAGCQGPTHTILVL